MANDNKLLGEFDLVGIPPSPRGVPQIEVSFDIDADGIMNVSAVDKGTGKKQSVVIQSSGGLTEKDIEKMIKDAEANKEKDKQRREIIDARNELDSLIHNTKKSLSEHKDKINSETKQSVEKQLLEAEGLAKIEDLEKLKAAIDELQKAALEIGQQIYKTNPSSSSSSSTSSESGDNKNENEKNDENVQDAEFKEKK